MVSRAAEPFGTFSPMTRHMTTRRSTCLLDLWNHAPTTEREPSQRPPLPRTRATHRASRYPTNPELIARPAVNVWISSRNRRPASEKSIFVVWCGRKVDLAPLSVEDHWVPHRARVSNRGGTTKKPLGFKELAACHSAPPSPPPARSRARDGLGRRMIYLRNTFPSICFNMTLIGRLRFFFIWI